MEIVSLQEIAGKIKMVAGELKKTKWFKTPAEEMEKIAQDTQAPLLVMVMGEFSTGKSTFINALLGKNVASVNDTPTTAVITKLCYGDTEHLTIYFKDGRRESHSLDQISDLTSETGGKYKSLRQQIEYVEVAMPIAILRQINIIDSPGLNADKKEHLQATKSYMDKADAVFWMFSADAAGKDTELKAIKALSPRLKPIGIVNKIDEIDEEEESVDDVLASVRGLMKNSVSQIIGVSAQWALNGKLKKNSALLAASNFTAVDAILNDKIAPERDSYKMNSLLEALAEVMLNIGVTCANRLETIEIYKDLNYDKYIKEKAEIGKIKGLISRFADHLAPAVQEIYGKGNPSAQLYMGIAYYYGYGLPENKEKAVDLLESMPETGNALNGVILGVYYIKQKEFEKGFYWLQQAADKGDANAAVLLGVCYENGVVVDENPQEAAKWFTKGTEQNNDDALEQLGKCYFSGYGVDKDIQKAITLFEKAAAQDNTNAQVMLGRCYTAGAGVAQNLMEAAKWFSLAAEQDDADGQYYLGLAFLPGNGVEKDVEKAFHLFELSARQDNALAQNKLGQCYESGIAGVTDEAEAFKWYRRAAEQGLDVAQHNLALCYADGVGVTRDYTEAIKWYEKAAEQGVAPSGLALSEIYRQGRDGVEQNTFESIKWLRKSAELDFAPAQNKLAVRYFTGDGVNKDLKMAADLTVKAAEQGDAVAQYNLGYLYEQGEVLPQNLAKAVEWYTKAVDQGVPKAICKMAALYETGQGVSKNISQALRLYRQAADNNDPDAQARLADIYTDGDLVTADEEEAVQWYKKAAANGHSDAQNKLAVRYYEGHGVPKNTTEAVHLYEAALQQGHVAAAANLGFCYLNGIGVAKNNEKAYQLFESAANRGSSFAKRGLSICYRYGYGVTKNINQAIVYLKESAELADVSSENDLGEIYLSGKEGVPKDISAAMLWLGRAAEHGNMHSQYLLGTCYEQGLSGTVNLQLAVHWYELAANAGHAAAHKLLKQVLAELEKQKMFNKYYTEAKNGNSDAQYRVGEFYRLGDGVKSDMDEAITWYKKAADNGNKDASYTLYNHYEKNKKEKEAKKYLKMAGAQGHAQAIEKLAAIRKRAYIKYGAIASVLFISFLVIINDSNSRVQTRSVNNPVRQEQMVQNAGNKITQDVQKKVTQNNNTMKNTQNVSSSYTTYHDSKYGYTISIPRSFKKISESGNTMTFEDSSGAQIKTFGETNDSRESAADVLKSLMNNTGTSKFSYTDHGDTWLAASWVEGNKASYQKTFVSPSSFVTFRITFPKSVQSRYEDTISYVEANFKSGFKQ